MAPPTLGSPGNLPSSWEGHQYSQVLGLTQWGCFFLHSLNTGRDYSSLRNDESQARAHEEYSISSEERVVDILDTLLPIAHLVGDVARR